MEEDDCIMLTLLTQWLRLRADMNWVVFHQNELEKPDPRNIVAWCREREIRKVKAKARCVKAVAMKKQGSWTRWEDIRQRVIWTMEGSWIKFLMFSVYDVLLTYLVRESPSCKLCG